MIEPNLATMLCFVIAKTQHRGTSMPSVAVLEASTSD